MQSKNQTLLITLLASQSLFVLIYSIIAFSNEDANLFSIFFGNLASFTWNGQFSLDFSCYLLLSGLWIGWRNKFSTLSILIAMVAAIVGIMAFAPYVIYLIISEKGDLKKVLLGSQG